MPKKGCGIGSKVYKYLANKYRESQCPGQRPLKEGEYHFPPCMSYCGPGTNIHDPNVKNAKPYNDVDNVCREHDLNYEKASKLSTEEGERLRRKADEDMLQQLNKYPNQEGHDIAKFAIGTKVKLENALPGFMRRLAPGYFGSPQGGQIEIPKKHMLDSKPYPESYTRQVQKSMIIISNDPKKIIPYGSFIYKSQAYPGDIDLVEPDIYVCDSACSEGQGYRNAVDIFTKIVERIHHSKDYYLGDLKLGNDIDIFGLIEESGSGFGKTVKESLQMDRDTEKVKSEDYDPKSVLRAINTMKSKRYISQKSYDELIKIMNNKEFDEFTRRCHILETLRKLIVLRWTYEDIHRGYKILEGNRRYTIEQAFRFLDYAPNQHEVSPIRKTEESNARKVEIGKEHIDQPALPLAKIDMFTIINGKFVEITNLLTFKFVLHKNDQKDTEVQLSYGYEDIISDLKAEIAKYYWNPLYDKPMKMAKRIYSLARTYNDIDTAKPLIYLFQSDINRLNMVNSLIDMYLNMFKLIKHAPIAEMKPQIDSLKDILSKIILFDWEDKESYKMIDIIAHPKTPAHIMIEHLEHLHEYFSEVVKEKVREYLIIHKMYPINNKKYLDKQNFGLLYN